jgi:hypothetical protein
MQKTSPSFSPKDFFLWLGAMVALYVSVGSFITLVFQYINVLFPDALMRGYDPYSSSIRFAIASLIIIFPVYLWITRILGSDLRKNPSKREYGFRKWLIYITLFVAGVSIVADLVTLVNFFLNGDITARFILKVLTVLVVAGVVFFYYLADLRGRWEKEEGTAKNIGIGAGLIVLVSVIAGFFIIGSPMTARDIRFDQQRVSDLQSIQWQLVQYWQSKTTLPDDITQLNDSIQGFVVPVDPETSAAYEYQKTASTTFALCATFAQSSTAPADTVSKEVQPIAYNGTPDNWDHGSGRQCFTRTIDPDRYPPFNKNPTDPKMVPAIAR